MYVVVTKTDGTTEAHVDSRPLVDTEGNLYVKPVDQISPVTTYTPDRWDHFATHNEHNEES